MNAPVRPVGAGSKRRLPGPAGSVSMSQQTGDLSGESSYLTLSQQFERKKEIVQHFCMAPWLQMCGDLNIPTVAIDFREQSGEGEFPAEDIIGAICENDAYFQQFLSLCAENMMSINMTSGGGRSDDPAAVGAPTVLSTLRSVSQGHYVAAPTGTAAVASAGGGKVRRLLVVVDGMQVTANAGAGPGPAGGAVSSLLLRLIVSASRPAQLLC